MLLMAFQPLPTSETPNTISVLRVRCPYFQLYKYIPCEWWMFGYLIVTVFKPPPDQCNGESFLVCWLRAGKEMHWCWTYVNLTDAKMHKMYKWNFVHSNWYLIQWWLFIPHIYYAYQFYYHSNSSKRIFEHVKRCRELSYYSFTKSEQKRKKNTNRNEAKRKNGQFHWIRGTGTVSLSEEWMW